jgi:CspA family cold shock protein
MQKGFIKFFNEKGGWGFITTMENGTEKGEDYFFHIRNTNFKSGEPIRNKSLVEFELIDGKKGKEASNVRYRVDDADLKFKSQ